MNTRNILLHKLCGTDECSVFAYNRQVFRLADSAGLVSHCGKEGKQKEYPVAGPDTQDRTGP